MYCLNLKFPITVHIEKSSWVYTVKDKKTQHVQVQLFDMTLVLNQTSRITNQSEEA